MVQNAGCVLKIGVKQQRVTFEIVANCMQKGLSFR